MAAQMTSCERLLAAIHHEEPDRVPVSPRIGAYLTVTYGSSSWMHHLKAAREFGFDLMLPVASPVPAFIHAPQLTYRWLPSEVRVRQEIVLGIGGVRALKALGIEPTDSEAVVPLYLGRRAVRQRYFTLRKAA